jgi:hypothetical protein
MTLKGLRFIFCACSGVAVAGACTSDAWIGAERPAPVDAGMSESGRPPVNPMPEDAGACVRVLCGKRLAACGDCDDNDGDGLVDMNDPDCIGPCQTGEDTFANLQPGQGHGSCTLDCYFDQDNGIGNDDCEWSHKCDELSVPPDYPPEGMGCAYNPDEKFPRGGTCTSPQSDKCVSVCGPLTPNGCDCFGCCKAPGAETAVFIGSVDEAGKPTCDSAHLNDKTRCKPCTQVESCVNSCKNCELCFGKRALPPSCGQQGPACVAPECPPNAAPCGLECLPTCTTGSSCITGCCTEPPR